MDADPEGPEPWLATAYAAGPSLAGAMDSHGPLPAEFVLTLAAGLAEGLQAIHAAGLVQVDDAGAPGSPPLSAQPRTPG